ncbi:MAG: 50S ribosomal protein L23 [Rickettsiales bacterium]|jgi:large subunit ribosomal protein L23|nr:50S ribosomal protein L23 [Rickettsiales bacterium]
MAEKKVVLTAKSYDILQRPIISEKAAKLAEANGLVFEVANDATKTSIADAVQAIYNVRPSKVNIVVAKGKVKTFRNKSKGTQRTIKKAYLTLPKGVEIDILAEAGKK